MKLFKNLFKSPNSDRDYWVYVRCDKCGEVIKARIDLFNHLSIQYGEGNQPSTYFCRKVVIGGKRCYQQIEVLMTFDMNRKLLDQQITGGKFVTKDEYLASVT